jgi:glycosyltransferase involved in cell wall biosynthesis
LSDALNLGIQNSRGDFIARMDADDISEKNRLEFQLKNMIENDSDICGSHFITIDKKNNLIDAKIMPLTKEAFSARLITNVPFSHGSVMLRKKFLKINDLSYSRIGRSEDYRLWIDFYNKSAKFSNVDMFLYRYRVYENSLSLTASEQSYIDYKNLRRNFIENNELKIEKDLKKYINNHNSLSKGEKIKFLYTVFIFCKYTRSNLFFSALRYCSLYSILYLILNFSRSFQKFIWQFKFENSNALISEYDNFLIKNEKTDTIIAFIQT